MDLIRAIQIVSATSLAWGLCLGFQQKRTTEVAPKRGEKKQSNSKPSVPESLMKDDDGNDEYWFHDDIHALGNTGILGGLHAAMAPISTKMIDFLAYKGTNVRETVAKQLMERVLQSRPSNVQKDGEVRVLDLGCGVGMSTLAIASAFRQEKDTNVTIVGVDTSPEMIAMARTKDLEQKGITKLAETHRCPTKHRDKDWIELPVTTTTTTTNTEFLEANAEKTPFPKESFDLVTIMYVLHEVPLRGRKKILREARRLLRPGGMLAVVDISQDYEPSPSMLSGEPYLMEYQKNFSKQMATLAGFRLHSQEIVVPGHVVVHTLVKKSNPKWLGFLW